MNEHVTSNREVAARCNTMFMPRGIPASKGTAPQELVEGLNFGQFWS